jgi:hypothetical protein
MKAAICILAALLLVSAGLNVLLSSELRGEQVKNLERFTHNQDLKDVLIDRAGDCDRERLWKEDVDYLYTIIAAYENRIHRHLPSRKIKRGRIEQTSK